MHTDKLDFAGVFCKLSLSMHDHESYARFVNDILEIEEVVE